MDTKRFNNPEYKQQIRAVRNYRRQVAPSPETKLQAVLEKTGMGSIKNQIFTAIAVALLVYLTYFAKFLIIRDINISGADQQATQQIQNNFQEFRATYRGRLLPEKNILFFSKAKFKDYLLSHNYQVAAVPSISARLWNHVSIKVEQRAPKYSLQVGSKVYILNSDSTIGSEIPQDQPNPYLVIKDTAEETLNPGEKFFDEDKNIFIQRVSSDIETKLSLPIDSYEVPGRASDQIVVHLKKGFKVYFVTTTDPNEYFQRFYTLWLQLNPDQQNRLAYFDFRFEKNAYSCNKSDPCAKQ